MKYNRPMTIDILSLFPDSFTPLGTSMMKRAQEAKLVEINIHDLRNWATDKHKTVDGRPFGGGKGMVLKIEPIFNALKDLKSEIPGQARNDSRVILMTPQGDIYDQQKAKALVKVSHLILIAGHYEGYDQRIREHLVDEEISIGRYVLTGGEVPAMVVVDSIVRLIPGVLDKEARENESFYKGDELDHPQYTRPEEFNGWKVPEVLLSGNHKEIEKWRNEKK